MGISLGTLVVDLEANTAEFTSDLNKSTGVTKKFGKDLVAAGKKAALAAGAAFAAFSVVAIKAASDAAETTSKFETVFGSATDEMNRFVLDLQNTVPATRKELQEMSSSLQDLLVPMGIIPDEAIKMNKEFVTLAADLASFNNIPIADALNKLRAGLVGSSEPLLQLGVDTRVAALEVKALELGLIKEGQELTNAARAQAVLAISAEQSTFAIGDAARTASSTANQMKFLSRDIKELTETAGSAMLPTFSTVLRMLVQVTSGAQDSGGAMTFLADAVAFPVMAFFRLAEAAQRLIVIPMLNVQKAIAQTLLFFAKLGKQMGNDTQPRIDELSLRILQIEDNMGAAGDAADGWTSKQADLIDSINQFKQRAKEAATSTSEFTEEAKDLSGSISTQLTPKVKGSTDRLIDMNIAMANAIALSQNLAISGSRLGSAQDNLGRATADALEIQKQQNEKLAFGSISFEDIRNATVAAEISAREYGSGVKKVKGELDDLTAEQAKNAKSTKDWGDAWSRQISTIVTDFSAGVADLIFEGKSLSETMVGIFKELGKTIVRGLIETLFDPVKNKLTDLLGGLLGGIPGLGGSAGGSAAGAAGGIFKGGASILTGGLSNIIGGALGGLLGGLINPSKGKEVSFNTRLMLGWIQDHFPVFVRNMEIGINTTQNAVNELINIRTWAEFQGGQQAILVTRMDTLIGIENRMLGLQG